MTFYLQNFKSLLYNVFISLLVMKMTKKTVRSL